MRLSNGEVLFAWPLSKHLLTVGNYYRAKDGTYKQWHGAIDLACSWDGSTAKPVLAAEPGTVVWVQKWDGHTTDPQTSQSYGNAVKIRHQSYKGTMLETLYAHLSRVDVAVGQQVAAGQTIGITGSTGNCQGAHLHFEVRWGNRRYNPLCWLDDDWQPAPGHHPYRYGPGEHAVERPQSRAVWGYGIDLSKHQWAGKQPVDFDAVRASGKRFVIARAGLGWYPDQVDQFFSRTCTAARAAGLEVGAYWYSYAATPEDARKEAKLFADTVQGQTLTMGLWMDQEYEPEILALTNAQRTEIVQAFCAEVQRLTGTSCGLYCSRDWINSKLDADKLRGMELWVAAYTGTDSPGQVALPYGIWQTDGSKTGRCPGVDGPVDRNICYEEREENIMKFESVKGLKLVATPDKHACEIFAVPDTAHPIGRLADGEVLEITAKGDTIQLGGMEAAWYEVQYETAPGGEAYVLALPDRCKVQTVPDQPEDKPAEPIDPQPGHGKISVILSGTSMDQIKVLAQDLSAALL